MNTSAHVGTAMPGALLHRVNLAHVGGVEVSFAQYHAHRRAAHQTDALLIAGALNPRFDAVANGIGTIHERGTFKHWHGIRLPRFARRARTHLAARALRSVHPAAVIAWNGFGNREIADISGALGCPLIHYEHGNAWRFEADHARHFLDRVTGVIANSHAAERMLALRWGWRGPMARVYCAVAAGAIARRARPALQQSRPPRLGVAGRLADIKGQALALHALHALHHSYGIDATLALAGEGPTRDALAARARYLGIERSVSFEGLLADMAAFYDSIDMLLIPSLREPFGRTGIEAQARGCPVVAAGVDGLPETLPVNEVDRAIAPDLPRSDYATFGGDATQLPPLVFDPVAGRLIEPRLVDPMKLAAAVGRLIAAPQDYADASARALANVRQRFSEARYNAGLDAAITRFAGLGTRS